MLSSRKGRRWSPWVSSAMNCNVWMRVRAMTAEWCRGSIVSGGAID